jgi:transposase
MLQRLLRFACRGGLKVGAARKLIMALGYRPVNRDQMMLLPPDLRDWLPPRHFVWFLLAVLDELDVSGFEAGRRLGSVGREGYDPRVLVGLLIYGYAHGQRSSRRIEELCSTDVAFRVICAQDAPDHTTIARFRQANDQAAAELFVRVLELAGEAGLGRVGVIAVDGTRIAANASWGANRRRSWLRERVEEAMAEAERVDAEEDAQFGPDVNGGEVQECWTDPGTRAGRIKAALARTEQLVEQQSAAQDARVARWQDRVDRAAERHGQERASAEERHQAYQQQQAAAGRGEGPRPGHRPAPPPDQAATTRKAAAQLDRLQARRDAAAVASARAARDPVANLTDPDSGWMPTGKGWIQGYNTQLAVSQDQIVLGVKVTNATVDVDQFEPMLAAAARGAEALNRGRARAGRAAETIGQVLADAGYFSEHNLIMPGPDRLIASAKRQRLEEAAHHSSAYLHDDESPADACAAMKARLLEPDAIAAYRRRGVIVEPVNGHLKDRHGLRQYSRRGWSAAQAETELAATTANLLKIWRYRR